MSLDREGSKKARMILQNIKILTVQLESLLFGKKITDINKKRWEWAYPLVMVNDIGEGKVFREQFLKFVEEAGKDRRGAAGYFSGKKPSVELNKQEDMVYLTAKGKSYVKVYGDDIRNIPKQTEKT